MQELIDDLKELKKHSKERNQDTSFDIGMTFAIARAELRLCKEKEQIIEAYGRAVCMFYESEQPEEYYNETFNQDRELPSDVKNILDNL